jgi:spermidine/putrescine transport system permease protein
MLWLLIFFLIPIVSMGILSLEKPLPTTGFLETGYRFAWNVAEYATAWSLYHTQFVRSMGYAGVVTLLTLLVGYPVAYWIAFYAGSRKTVYLFLLLLPFFVSFVIRSLAWQFVLSDNGLVLRTLESWRLVPSGFHVLSTPTAVIAGIAYNSLPFMILPLYVSLEKIDRGVVDAARDLYASPRDVLRRIVVPLSLLGIFAGFLLTFVPAAGDYVNATILGGTNTTMIGNVIQFQFLTNGDFPMASALSVILMAVLMVGILAYARALGSRQLSEFV